MGQRDGFKLEIRMEASKMKILKITKGKMIHLFQSKGNKNG